MTTETKLPEIVNLVAFNMGYGAFFNGSRKPYSVSSKLAKEIAYATSPRKLKALGEWFAGHGLTLTKDDTGWSVYQITQAECPYKPLTYAAKEWQRGFDKAYFTNIERNKNARYSHHSATSKRGPGKWSAGVRPRQAK